MKCILAATKETNCIFCSPRTPLLRAFISGISAQTKMFILFVIASSLNFHSIVIFHSLFFFFFFFCSSSCSPLHKSSLSDNKFLSTFSRSSGQHRLRKKVWFFVFWVQLLVSFITRIKMSYKARNTRTRTRVGKYELGKTLGEGSFGKVKFANNVDTGGFVAIKILDREQVLRHKMVEQIKREISTMKLIKHPNVLKLFEVMASKTKIYIVLEFVDGGELFDKIASHGRLKEDEARSYFQQLINAIDYCHSRGVFHRDLKPENLLLDSNGVLKVSDFGLSAISQQAKEDGLLHTACGTPNYVAPEVLTSKGYDGTSSDVWSCGVILFVLMAGYLPFDEANQMALYRKICRAEFTCPLWFSLGARNLIKRILDPNPLTRITISEILEDEWFKKGYQPPQFEKEEDVNLDDVDAVFNDSKVDRLVTEKKEKPVSMNAFELISRSQSFNLENLFEKQGGLVKRETRFTSQRPPKEIMDKIEETAKPLGFNVHKQNYKMKLKGGKTGRKGHLSVATEVFEVAPSLHMVELRKTGGDTLEFHNFYKSFSSGLKDVMWKSEESSEVW